MKLKLLITLALIFVVGCLCFGVNYLLQPKIEIAPFEAIQPQNNCFSSSVKNKSDKIYDIVVVYVNILDKNENVIEKNHEKFFGLKANEQQPFQICTKSPQSSTVKIKKIETYNNP